MRKLNTSIQSVDEYIASVPIEHRDKLKCVRDTIKKTAPNATESISYGMPYYHLNGRLIYFGLSKSHIGIYPMAEGVAAFKDKLTDYQTSKGAIQLPLDKPLPLPLIAEIVRFRVAQNLKNE